MDLTPDVFTIVIGDDGYGIDVLKRKLGETKQEQAGAAKTVRDLISYTGSTILGFGKTYTLDETLFQQLILENPALDAKRKAELQAVFDTKTLGDQIRVQNAMSIPGYSVPGGVVVSDAPPVVMPAVVVYFVDP